ncbi:MAG: lipid IV(A) 3-deoxy-D-manno-octulosonic acid transferase [Gammaproteobacteria bacterium]
MRLLYLVLSYILAPSVIFILLWKGMTNRAYFERFEERFGFGRSRTDRPSIWIHAVSVGEVVSASPMVWEFRRKYPDLPVVMSTVTPTGGERVAALFGDDVIHSYIPYDTPGAVSRFFDRFNPRLAIIMETELWPNLFAECGAREVPLVMANARISPRSVNKYKRFVGLFRETLAFGILIAAQSQRDAERFLELGAAPERTHAIGNLKFDFDLPAGIRQRGQALRREIAGARPVWVAASTHEGEEEQILAAHRQILEHEKDALLILVPRHRERFETVAELLRQSGMCFERRSSQGTCGSAYSVFLGDTLGELLTFYSAADVAFVAGSLEPVGGHNLLEPAALGIPVLTGPHNFNAEDVVLKLTEGGAAKVISGSENLAREVIPFLTDPALRAAWGSRGQQIVSDNRGALRRLLDMVEPLLDEPAGSASTTL